MATTQDVLENHLDRFAAGDLDGLMADYIDESVLFTPEGPLHGPPAIRRVMTGLFSEFAKPGARFTMKTRSTAGEVGYIVWSAETADQRYELATDTFVVRDGKIAFQSFAAKVVPRA
jgi:ketosteroid isomerase-like protein